jgi:precorrin-6B C5,15-methyltransferase / cobalt-precorrin-6B C5,C15-methyltransferase
MRAIAQHPQVFLFTGPENSPARLARALLTAGYTSDEIRISVACRLQLPDEQLFPLLSLDAAATTDFPEPNVVLVRRAGNCGAPAFGLDDLEYIQRSPEKG